LLACVVQVYNGGYCCVDAATTHVPSQSVNRRAYPSCGPGDGHVRDQSADANLESYVCSDSRWQHRRSRTTITHVVIPSFVHPFTGTPTSQLRSKGRQVVPRGLLAELRQRQRAKPPACHIRVIRVSF